MKNKNRELLFSVTAVDCRWDYYRGSGAGGQHRNKTSSAVRCTHLASGAVGQAEDSRSQHENKQLAFVRMSETSEFKRWHQTETYRRLGKLADIDQAVEQAMHERHLRVEGRVDGRWVPIDEAVEDETVDG